MVKNCKVLGAGLYKGRIATATTTTLLSAVAVVIIITCMSAITIIPASTAFAAAGSYVETVTFTRQPSADAAVDNLIAGNIDMYYDSISGNNLQRIRDSGNDLYQSASGSTFSLDINPTDDHTNGFNPFAYREVRYAVNYMIDRHYIVDNFFESGVIMPSAMPPYHHDFLFVYSYLTSLDFEYNLQKADSLIKEALEPTGATKSAGDGKWYYDGEQITVKLLVRPDDATRAEIGRIIADSLEKLGFRVDVIEVDLTEAFRIVDGTDPAAQEWHMYTGATSHLGYTRYNNYILGVSYAPAFGGLPGYGVDSYWNYKNDDLDRIAIALLYAQYNSEEQRAQWVRDATRLGVNESVVVYIGIEHDHYPVRGDVTGIVDSDIFGIENPYTPLTVQLESPRTNLEIGVRHVSQSSWNPVGGFRDVYSNTVWDLIHDTSLVYDPHTLDILDSRSMTVSVETNGRGGKVPIPSDAFVWGDNARWVPATETEATSKVTFDLKLSNWHNGQPMDVNDLLYPVVFNREHSKTDGTYLGEPFELPDMYAWLRGGPDLVGIRVLDDNTTVEAYINYWHPNENRIAKAAAMWPQMPWEVYHAMDMAVHGGTADWWRTDASVRNSSWLSMIDSDDTAMVRMYLEMAKERDASDHVPVFLYTDKNSEYVNARYDATLEWIDNMDHVAISNGPFYLSGPIVRDAEDGSISKMTLSQFDDPTYPFGPEMWKSFTEFELSRGDLVIGSLAPVSGNAHRYGAEIQGAIDFGVYDFNRYLEARGLDWRLAPRNLDTATSPDVAYEHLEQLNADGVNLVLGPSIDIITRDMVRYADENDMILLSCCSSVPSLAIPGDSLYRMLPDQRAHAQAIVDIMTHENIGIKHIIPVGIDGAWATELLEAAKTQFEAGGGRTSSDIIIYTNPQRDGLAGSTDRPSSIMPGDINLDDAAGMLAAEVRRAAAQHGSVNVAVLYIGFGEGPEFLKAASEYGVLDGVRWFGADQNTAYPNIADDPASADFARAVKLTTVQPNVHAIVRDRLPTQDRIGAHLQAIGAQESAYSKYAYDSVWLLGLSILHAHGSNTADVKSALDFIASIHIGVSGATAHNNNGDLAVNDPRHRYVAWSIASSNTTDGSINGWVEHSLDLESRPPLICR